MKRFWLMGLAPLFAALLLSPAFAQENEKETKPAAKNEGKSEEGKKDDKDAGDTLPEEVRNKVSYLLGFNSGREFKQKGIDVKPEVLTEGLADGLSGKMSKYTDEELKAAVEALFAFQAKRREIVATTNLKEGKAFLEKNGKREGITTTKSGLQYEVIKKGEGKSPKKTDTVVTHYHGTLIDGTVFDSSVQRKSPATFEVSGVIKGWTEVLQLMKPGDKWKIYVPSDLAYGENPRPGPIGPNAVLIFEIELLSIEDAGEK